MNNSELSALLLPISNDARTLYLLGLRPQSDPITGITLPLDYNALLGLLNSKEQKFNRGRQINSLLKELIAAELVHVNQDDDIQLSLNDKQLTLSKRADIDRPTITDKHVMTMNWQPDSNSFNDICSLIGIIDKDYSDTELGEFIAYWLGRTDIKLSSYQWSQRFAQQIKRNRTALDSTTMKQTGTQTHTNTVSSVEADDNAKRLVAKYKKTKNNK